MANTIDSFFTKYPILKYDKNQMIIHADDIPSGIFYIKSGFVKMSAILENGREITINIFKTGAYFPMIWAITNIPNTYYYKTVTTVELQRVPRDVLLEFMQKNPGMLFNLIERILRGVQGLLINIEHELSGDSYHRVIAALVLSAKRFGVKEKENAVIIDFPLTHQEIADITGITRETVSLSIEKLEKAKIVSYKKHTLVINNIMALDKESTILKEDKPTPNIL